MKKIIGILLSLVVASAAAQEKQNSDPFDLSALSSKVDELGIITKPEVDALEEKAKELFAAEKYEEAIPALSEYAKRRIG